MDSDHTSYSEMKPCCKPYKIDNDRLYRCFVADAPPPDHCEHQLCFARLEFCLHKSATEGDDRLHPHLTFKLRVTEKQHSGKPTSVELFYGKQYLHKEQQREEG